MASNQKLQKSKTYSLNVQRNMPGGFHQGGGVAAIYTRDASGDFEYIGRHFGKYHFYCGCQGVDIYLDEDQLVQALAGELVTVRMDEWA